MPLNTTMPATLRPYFEEELNVYRAYYAAGQWRDAWRHLERAHILGQRYPLTHNYVHWKMLQFGFRIKDAREVMGQIPRLIFGGVKSFVGSVPIGNPGGADVPPMKSFPIAEDLQAVFVKAGVVE